MGAHFRKFKNAGGKRTALTPSKIKSKAMAPLTLKVEPNGPK
jgi:hypothetical protein